VRRDFIDANILRIVREGMRETVTEGTAQPLKDLPVHGSRQDGDGPVRNRQGHAWVVRFFCSV
jgi:hypothetical protein